MKLQVDVICFGIVLHTCVICLWNFIRVYFGRKLDSKYRDSYG